MTVSDSLALLRGAVQLMWSTSDQLAKRLVLSSLLAMLGASVIAAIPALFLKALVDVLGEDRAHTVQVVPAALILACAFAHWSARSLGEFRGKYLGRADQRVHRLLSGRFFRHVMSLPLRYHLERKTGALSQTLANGLLGYRIVLTHLVSSILPVLIELASVGAVLVILGHPIFLLVIAVAVAGYAATFWVGAVRIIGPAREASTAHIDACALLTDAILNFETVKYFNGETRLENSLASALSQTEDRWSELFRRKLNNSLLINFIFASSYGLSLYVAANMVQQGGMSVGAFVLVSVYIPQVVLPLEKLGLAFRDVIQGVAFIEKMTDLLREKPEPGADIESNSRLFGSGELIFENVSFAYETNRHILQGISFAVPCGKTLAIVGVSGSGKSSLVRLLLRLLEPTEGQIYLGGVPLSQIPTRVLRDSIAVVPQDIALFNDSIGSNIAFGRQGSTYDEVVAAAQIAGIHDFIIKLPNGYNTTVGERGVKLSGGEKQRLAIARAAVKKPRMFVFDEATSSLDSKTEQTILRDFFRASAETTLIIIAHRLSTIAHADQIIVLQDGRIVEIGSQDVLLRHGGVYATMWRMQHEDPRRTNEATLCTT